MRQHLYIVKSEAANDTTPALAVIRNLPLKRIQPIFKDCTVEELQYFMERAIQQEEYELCMHLKDLLELRYSYCVA